MKKKILAMMLSMTMVLNTSGVVGATEINFTDGEMLEEQVLDEKGLFYDGQTEMEKDSKDVFVDETLCENIVEEEQEVNTTFSVAYDLIQPSEIVKMDDVYYYKISCAEELAYIASMGGEWLKYNYILSNDIVLNNKKIEYDKFGNLITNPEELKLWEPIRGFSGIFNGNGFSISGVYINSDEESGFFCDFLGDLYNLTITNSYVKGGDYTGGFCGTMRKIGGEIENCIYIGAVVGNSNVGGLIGENNCSYIRGCKNLGDVWGNGDYVAGIVGNYSAYGIEDCVNNGTIQTNGNYVGGIAGYSNIYYIRRSINNGNIYGNQFVGGIIGKVEDGDFSNCGNTGGVSGKRMVGGICGYTTYNFVTSWMAEISNSFNSGKISGEELIGGITGYLNYGVLIKCCNIGEVNGNLDAGTVVGKSESIWGRGEVKECYYLENVDLNGIGNVQDVKGQTEAVSMDFFCRGDGSIITVHDWTKDKIIKKNPTCTDKGIKVRQCYICGTIDETTQEEIPAYGHKWNAWQTVSKATVFVTEKQKRSCRVCGVEETKSVGTKVTPTIKLNYTNLTLKVGQSTSAVKVSGLAVGDSVKSWKSSNTKIVKVDSKGKITAQKSTGKATITVTLASKKTARITVTVQKSTVKTKKLTGLKSSITLKKGQKVALKPVRSPITATEKITYTSSNTKIATVTSSGVIYVKAAGTAKITVKSGSAKFIVTVTVPKTKTTAITNIKKSIIIKKGTSYTLKPKISPSNSDEKITYVSSDKKTVTVSSKGVIKGIKKGKAVITVKSGSKTVKCTVTVK